MGEFSIVHWLVIGVIALIFFGPSRLPSLGKSLGQAIKGFKQGINEMEAEVKNVDDKTEQLPGSQAQQQQQQERKEKQNS